MPMHLKIRHYACHLSEAHALLADKLVAKDYVRSVVPEERELSVPEVVRVLEGPEDVRPADLAHGLMVKSAHACKWNIVGGEVDAAVRKLRRWASSPFSSRRLNEQHYGMIKPRFFVERIVEDAVGPFGEAVCHMVRCVHGRPISVSAILRRSQASYDMASGTCVHRTGTSAATIPDPDPELVQRMIGLAARLAQGLEFVRVDFYASAASGRLWFSELTFTPAAGAPVFDDAEEMRQGRLWTM
jgi:hypothetical protein